MKRTIITVILIIGLSLSASCESVKLDPFGDPLSEEQIKTSKEAQKKALVKSKKERNRIIALLEQSNKIEVFLLGLLENLWVKSEKMGMFK